MSGTFFERVAALPERAKPRTAGLIMLIDWGMGPNSQCDVLATGAAYVDLAKIAVGVGRLLPRNVLAEKIRLYQEQGVEPFPGGQFLEFAHVHQTQDAYFPAVVEAGYRWCEVSDNLAEVSLEWKQEMIRLAVADFGLQATQGTSGEIE